MKKQNIENIFELSPMQQGMLYHSLYSNTTDPYVYQYTARISGSLVIDSFKRAWLEVSLRHDILRTSFHWQDIEKPLQVVHKHIDLPILQEDWRALSEQEQNDKLEKYLKFDRESGFDINKPPLMRISLLRVGEDTYELIWSFHHILLDGWSVSLLLQEVFGFYESFSNRCSLEFEPARPFHEYIAWLQKQDIKDAEHFWKQTLKGFSKPTSLPNDLGINHFAENSDVHEAEILTLTANQTEALQIFARHNQLTVNTLVQGVWAIVLSQFSGNLDILFGTVVSGRPPEINGIERMIGLFINTLPARVRIDVDEKVIDWLKSLQSRQVVERRYEFSPLTLVQAWSDLKRGIPLFESIVAFENFPFNRVAKDQKYLSELKIISTRSFERNTYPLSLIVLPQTEIVFALSYNSRRFTRKSITRLLEQISIVIDSIVGKPDKQLRELLPDVQSASPESSAFTIASAEQTNLTQSQFLFWTAQHIQPDLPLFNMASLFIIQCKIDLEDFRKAIQMLIDLSDALRTTFVEENESPRQRVSEKITFIADFIDFSQQHNPKDVLRAWADERCRIPFKLTERLFDTALIKLDETCFVWYFNQHQLIADASATGIIVRIVSELYKSITNDSICKIALPEFQEYVTRERKYIQSPRYRGCQNFC